MQGNFADLRRTVSTVAVAGALAVAGLVAPAFANVVKGTPDGDRLVGTSKPDKVSGRKGDDRLNGKKGDDRLVGGGGNDKIFGGPGFDDIRGGGGNDVISVRDGEPDTINCGRGEDRVIVDAVEDGLLDCEEVVES